MSTIDQAVWVVIHHYIKGQSNPSLDDFVGPFHWFADADREAESRPDRDSTIVLVDAPVKDPVVVVLGEGATP